MTKSSIESAEKKSFKWLIALYFISLAVNSISNYQYARNVRDDARDACQHKVESQAKLRESDWATAYLHCGSGPEICTRLFPIGAKRVKEAIEEDRLEQASKGSSPIGSEESK